MKKTTTDLLNGNIAEQILLFFFPIMFGSIFQQLYNTVDAMIVGNVVGTAALGAVGGSTGTVINLLIGFVVGLSSGATVVIAQAYGSRNRDEVQRGVYSGMFLALVLGVFLTIVGVTTASGMLHLLNVPEDMFDLSLTYMRMYLIGLIPTLIYNTGAGILRAAGDSKRPLYYLIVSCIVNIILDILFVAVFGWGVSGAALATVISQVASCLLVLRDMKNTDDMYVFTFRELHVDFRVLKKILIIGLPVGIQSVLYSVSNLFIQAGVNQYGTTTVAAYTAFGKIDALFWNTSGALGTAALTFCGQNFGAGNITRVKKSIWISIMMYVIGALAISGVCLLAGPLLYRLFSSDPEVIENGMGILRFICPLWFTFCFVEVISSACRGCGDSLVPMLITSIGVGALRIGWITLYPGKTIYDTLLCYPVTWIITSTMFLIYYLLGRWMKRAMKVKNIQSIKNV